MRIKDNQQDIDTKNKTKDESGTSNAKKNVPTSNSVSSSNWLTCASGVNFSNSKKLTSEDFPSLNAGGSSKMKGIIF